jgi:hypothetical protein
MGSPAAQPLIKAASVEIVEHAGTKKLKILVMVNTRKASHVKKAISPKLPTDGRGRAPTTTLSKLIKKLNEENQPPGGWYKPQATSLKPEASSDER